MCLIVLRKIAPKLVIPCLKVLVADESGVFYYTPIQRTVVPSNGLLLPTYKWKRRIQIGNVIESGVIHSYEAFRFDLRQRFNFAGTVFLSWHAAFAICPLAYGIEKDIVSRAVYIPTLDKDQQRALAFTTTKRHTRNSLIKMFPELKKHLANKKG